MTGVQDTEAYAIITQNNKTKIKKNVDTTFLCTEVNLALMYIKLPFFSPNCNILLYMTLFMFIRLPRNLSLLYTVTVICICVISISWFVVLILNQLFLYHVFIVFCLFLVLGVKENDYFIQRLFACCIIIFFRSRNTINPSPS